MSIQEKEALSSWAVEMRLVKSFLHVERSKRAAVILNRVVKETDERMSDWADDVKLAEKFLNQKKPEHVIAILDRVIEEMVRSILDD